MRSKFLVGLTLTALLLAAGLATARPHGGPKPLDLVEGAIPDLALDAETESAVYEVLDAARETRRAYRSELRDAHEELRGLLEADEPDPEAVMAQADELGALAIEARKEGLRTLLELQGLLDSDQREALRSAVRQGGFEGGRCRSGEAR